MIKLSNVNRIYETSSEHKVHALKEVTLELYPGELTSIIGASGSGKSTLMNIIGGLDGGFNGEVKYLDHALSKNNSKAMADYRKDNVGFIFQHFHLIPHLTVLENVMLALSMTDINNQEKEHLSKEVLSKVGLEEVIFHKGNELSGGQKQRVAIARALVKNPSIILADEPTGALDSSTSQEIINLLKTIVKDGRLVIIITHDAEISRSSDRAITLKDGMIIKDEHIENTSEKNDNATPNISIRKSSYKEAILLSLRRIRYNKWRYFLVSIGGIVGLIGLFLALMLSQGVNDYVESSYDKIVDRRKVVISSENNYISDDDYFSLNGNENVDYIQKEHKISAVTTGTEPIKFNVSPLQKEKYRDLHAKPKLLYGRLPSDNKDGIAIDEGLAKRLAGNNDLESLIGTKLFAKYLSPDKISNYPARWDHQEFLITGIVEKSFIGENYSYVSYQTHEDIVKRSRFIGKNASIDSNELTVYMKKSEDIKIFKASLKNKYIVQTPEDQIKSLITTFNILKISILGISAVILIIASIMVGIILFISVLERKNEIGVLKALGGRRQEIRWIFFAEGGIVGAFASITSVLLGLIFFFTAKNLAPESQIASMFVPSVSAVVITCLTGMITHLIATVIPANKASQFDPVELLRE
jgi:ABC-type lipoprotein export system ATPase subunit/ABC-type lipoprotein release transport system permease subunit